MSDFLSQIYSFIDTPYFGIALTIGAYVFAVWLHRKVKLALLLPFYIAVAVIILFLLLTGVSYETYMKGGEYISLFMGPLTVSLALPLYRHFKIIKKNWLPILFGILTGCLVSFFSTWLLAVLLQLSADQFLPLTLHSVTTPIALATAEAIGASGSLAVVGLILAALFSALAGPYLLNLFRIKDPVARGVAYGTSAHVIGTSKAAMEGVITGSFSGLSIGVAGIVTVVLIPFLLQFFYV